MPSSSAIIVSKHPLSYACRLDAATPCRTGTRFARLSRHLAHPHPEDIRTLTYRDFVFIGKGTRANPGHRVEHIPSPIERYCLHRLLRRVGGWDPARHVVIFGTEPGPQVPEECRHDGHDEYAGLCEELFSFASGARQVLFALRQEYTYLDAAVAGAVQAEIVRMSLREALSRQGHLALRGRHDYPYRPADNEPVGVLLDGGALVDGWRRLAFLISSTDPDRAWPFVSLRSG